MVGEIERSRYPRNLSPLAAFEFSAKNRKVRTVCSNSIPIANKLTAVDGNLCHGDGTVAININGIVIAFEDAAVDSDFLFRIAVTDLEGSRSGICTLNRTGLLHRSIFNGNIGSVFQTKRIGVARDRFAIQIKRKLTTLYQNRS